MKKRIVLIAATVLCLIAVIMMMTAKKEEKTEVSKGAKLVFGREERTMRDTEETDIEVSKTKCESEIYIDRQEDENIGY